MCILIRGDIQIWEENDKVEKIKQMLLNSPKIRFLMLGERVINTADIVGIFTPQDLEDHTRRLNGEWKCKYGNWHKKGEECHCDEVKIVNGVKKRWVPGSGWI